MKRCFEELTGRSEKELIFAPDWNVSLHKKTLIDLTQLKEEAKKVGFEFCVASAFRSFERQQVIFNTKAKGQKPILDAEGKEILSATLNDHDKLFAILRWSALPGASRHHWGSEFDVFDQNAISKDYHLQLIPQEFSHGGPFERLNNWLEEMMQNKNFPFYRPYFQDLGGVSPEPWHLSHKLSQEYFEQYTFEVFKKNIEISQIEFKELILDNAHQLFDRFVTNVTQPPWPSANLEVD